MTTEPTPDHTDTIILCAVAYLAAVSIAFGVEWILRRWGR